MNAPHAPIKMKTAMLKTTGKRYALLKEFHCTPYPAETGLQWSERFNGKDAVYIRSLVDGRLFGPVMTKLREEITDIEDSDIGPGLAHSSI